MDTIVLVAGILVTVLLIIGIILMHQEKIKELREFEEKKEWRREYRTNEEFISYP